MLIVKRHKTPNGEILVVSDKELLGKRFEEGKLQLDLKKDFYQGEEKTEAEIKALVNAAYILHLTGERTLKLFRKWGWIAEENVLLVKGIPHVEVCLVDE